MTTENKRRIGRWRLALAYAALSAVLPLSQFAALRAEEVAPAPTPSGLAVQSTIFSGELSAEWLPVSVAGGNFDAFAIAAPGLLRIDVPAGNGWAKTGIRSAAPILGNSGMAEGLRFRFDSAATDSFVIALAERDGDEEWGAHAVRLHWGPRSEGGGQATLFVRQREVWRVAVPAEAAPSAIDMVLDPSGAVAFILPDGRRMETVPGAIPPEGYRLHVVAHAPDAHLPARMALFGIDRLANAPAAAAIQPWPARQGQFVLFEGALGRLWAPVSLAGGNFSIDGAINSDGLTVSIPPGRGWSAAGMFSLDPAIWLEDFTPSTELVLEVAIDPAATQSFLFALSALGSPTYPFEAQMPNLMIQRHAAHGDAAARYEIHLNPHREGDFLTLPASDVAPDRFFIRLRPGEAVIELPGAEAISRKWADLVEGQGLRIVTYAIEPAIDAGTALKVSRITLHRNDIALEAAASSDGPDVAPLPAVRIFEGSMTGLWEPVGVAGGDFSQFAKPDPNGLVIDVPEGHGWAKTGILSTEPLIRLDALSSRTPTRIDVELDRSVSNTFNLSLGWDKVQDMWLHHLASYTLMPVPERGIWTLTLHHGTAAEWTREIDASWMRDHWDGHVWIDVAAGWTQVSLPGGPAIRAPIPFGAPQAHYATLVAHAPREGAAARMALKSVTIGRVSPSGMTAVDRWELLDPAAFDPAAYLQDLAQESEEP